MKKALKITSIIIASLLLLIFGFLGIYYLWPWNKSFFDKADKEFSIPGLDTTFTPQGMTKVEGRNQYLISGYMSDGTPSRYYLYDGDSDSIVKYFTLKTGEDYYYGHAGGVTSAGMTIWTVGDKTCLRFTLNDIDNVDNGGYIEVIDTFTTTNGADFVFSNDGILWIGEFYREGNYETAESHHLKTSSGETNYALVYGYQINEGMSLGLSSKVPVKLLSIRGLCQGIDIDEKGNFIMSTSYSIPDSNLYYYKNVLNEPCHMEYALGKNTIPLWFLDDNALISTMNAPSMAEELVVENSRVYVLFESNAKKYRLFNRKRLKNVYSIAISEFDK